MSRTALITRETKETKITLELTLEGGTVAVDTGIGFFDHMLTAMAFYAGFGLKLKAVGDLYVDGHHTVEDVGICLGLALKEALGEKRASPGSAPLLFLWTRPFAARFWISPTVPFWSMRLRCPSP